jgi:hypothetical protein
MATIRDVARESGVSIATVSRVFNHSPLVSVNTRERVLAASERLGYWPNGIARSLITSRTHAVGVLLPELHGDSSLGASLAAIVSEKTDFGTVHLNLQYERTRTHNDDLFAGLIVEGPKAWTVRPVAEIYIDREYSASITRSLLVGAIWQFNEDLAFDFGLRAARDGRDNVRELRAGLSWAFTP